MSKPTNKITRTIRSEQVLNAFIQVVCKNMPLDLKKTRITADDIIYALAYANVHRLSIESACQELQGAPSGNRLREVLAEALPSRVETQGLLNRIFRQQLHPSLLNGKRDHNIAIDLTLIPYHRQPYEDEKEIVRGAPKSGTTHFHGYATVKSTRKACSLINHGYPIKHPSLNANTQQLNDDRPCHQAYPPLISATCHHHALSCLYIHPCPSTSPS